MKGLKGILLTAVVAGGLASLVNAQEGLERTRLTKQPDIGNIAENINANAYHKNCGEQSIAALWTTNGWLYYKSDKNEIPYIQLKEDGTPKQNPFSFVGDTVYVNGDGDKKFDFSQEPDRQTACEVLRSLDKYVIKE